MLCINNHVIRASSLKCACPFYSGVCVCVCVCGMCVHLQRAWRQRGGRGPHRWQHERALDADRNEVSRWGTRSVQSGAAVISTLHSIVFTSTFLLSWKRDKDNGNKTRSRAGTVREIPWYLLCYWSVWVNAVLCFVVECRHFVFMEIFSWEVSYKVCII